MLLYLQLKGKMEIYILKSLIFLDSFLEKLMKMFSDIETQMKSITKLSKFHLC